MKTNTSQHHRTRSRLRCQSSSLLGKSRMPNALYHNTITAFKSIRAFNPRRQPSLISILTRPSSYTACPISPAACTSSDEGSTDSESMQPYAEHTIDYDQVLLAEKSIEEQQAEGLPQPYDLQQTRVRLTY